MSRAVTYRCVHRTLYGYGSPVSQSRQVVHLAPRTTPHQTCLDWSIDIAPDSHRTTHGHDYFGNIVSHSTIEVAHGSLDIAATSTVRLRAHGGHDPDATPPYARVRDWLATPGGRERLSAADYLFDTRTVRRDAAFAAFARDCFADTTPVLAGAVGLMDRIHSRFDYVPGATTVATPLTSVMKNRKGVCQDFAHLMLAALRSLGLAARYVSGYLLTHPPDGAARLIGADASHAWVSLFVPGSGWIDLDPTNNCLPELEHITVAWGRDFDDVSPVRGVFLGGGGAHTLEVSVDVRPVVLPLAREASRSDSPGDPARSERRD